MGRLLNDKQRKQLNALLTKEKYRRDADRIRAVLSYDDGQPAYVIARFFFVDESTVRAWINEYKDNGKSGLLKRRKEGKKSSLSEEQEDELKEELRNKLYRTTREIIAFVEAQFKVSFSISGMTKLLHRLGFSFKKPKGVPAKANLDLQISFLRTLRQILNHGLVFFADSTHPTLNPVLKSGWIEKGTEFEVKTSSGRQRVNVNGAIEVKSLQFIGRTCQTVDKNSILELLKAIRKKNPDDEKIYLVLDNAAYNRAKAVVQAAKELKIRILYLPPYSPNLNPIERLWKFMKKEILANRFYSGLAEFKSAVTEFMRGIRKHNKELRSLITTNFRLIEN